MESYEEIVESVLMKLWDVLHDLEVILPQRSDYFRVSIFGSSRVKSGDKIYEDVRFLAKELAIKGCDIVTGGGPGLMEAANLGAKDGNIRGVVKSFGLPIELPIGETKNPYLDRETLHRSFFSRLHHFVFLSSAFIAMPGGIGTLLEIITIWQLLQVKKLKDRPLILVGSIWKGLFHWMEEEMLKNHYLSEEDLKLPILVEDVKEVLPIIEKSLKEFQSNLRRFV
ncbi:MAG: LOG family protein [Thermoanaerobaculia bacterium]